MPCKACHKPKTTIGFIQGKRYSRKDGEDIYLAARVGENMFALISLSNGNRWNDPSSLKEIGKRNEFIELTEEN